MYDHCISVCGRYRPALAITEDGCAFDCLRVLVLNSCGLTSWKQVALIEKGLPSIEEVSLAYNDLSDLEPSLLQLQAATIYSSGMPSISASSIASCLAPSGSDEFIAPNASSPEMEHQGDKICTVGGLSVPSKEWGETVFGEPDYRSHIKNTHLTFKLPEGSKKIRFRLKIREGPMKMNSFVWLAAYIRLHVKNGDTWNKLTDVKYDYDAGYNEKYKAIYEEVTNHILTI